MRLFIAVDLGEPVHTRLAEQLVRLKPLAPRARWVQAGSLHVTLVFLGETADELVPRVGELVTEVARRHPQLVLRVGGGGAFGSSKRPRVLWTDLQGDVGLLGAVKADLERVLAEVGHRPEERDFHPHLTLARAREPGGDRELASCVTALAGMDFGQVRVDRLILYRSELSPGGARYTPLVQPLLGG